LEDASPGGRDEIGIDDISIEGLAPVIGFTYSEMIIAEGDDDEMATSTEYLIEIRMQGPPISDSITASINTAAGSATTGIDFSPIFVSPPVVFPRTTCYPRTETLLIYIDRDSYIEENEFFFVNLLLDSPSNGILGYTTQKVIIANDDPPPSPTLFSQT